MKVFDLTRPADVSTEVFPGDAKPEIIQVSTIKENGWNEKQLKFGSHFSTHIDAPFHMLEDGKKLDDFPVETFFGKAMAIDARKKEQLAKSLRTIKRGDIVFFLTGKVGVNRGYEESIKKEPAISLGTAQELVKKRVKIVGFDSLTVESAPFVIHKLFFKNNIPIVENLANLESVAGKRFDCFVLPLKVSEADAAPCRAIAIKR